MIRSIVVAMLVLCGLGMADVERPNIVWISTEDIGPHLGCYGHPTSKTPTLDGLAAQGVRYTATHTVTPVCATNRSSMITGMYASVLGTQHMRSGGKGNSNTPHPKLPEGVQPFTMYLREAGYFCTNAVKEDFNFEKPAGVWDRVKGNAHWRDRKDPEQPFFSVFNFTQTHESHAHITPEGHEKRVARLTAEERQDPDRIPVPPYQPNTPEVRAWWGRYLENITLLDHFVADRLRELEEDGLAENTIVVFWSDHGAGMPRNKRWLHDSGTHIPHIMYVPEKWRARLNVTPGTVDARLIASIDLAPDTLRMAGLTIPEYMQGQAFNGDDVPAPREHLFGIRDRMDERVDFIRSVRDKRYKYIRNFMPYKPFDQNLGYAERHGIKKDIRRLMAAGDDTLATEFWRLREKPMEQLYDCEADPYNVRNLVGDPAHEETLNRLRYALQQWEMGIYDTSMIPEPELHRLGLAHGSRNAVWPVLEKEEPGIYHRTMMLVHMSAKPAEDDEEKLLSFAGSAHSFHRYWAIVGLSQLDSPSKAAKKRLKAALEDKCPEVRVAAARYAGDLAVLESALMSEEEFVRIFAVQALDELDEQAKPLIPALEVGRKDPNNKYVSRIANQALNELQGTSEVVR